jgi:hypothetical protein
VHEVGVDVVDCACAVGAPGFVWVVQGREAAEAGFDLAVGCVERDAEVGVKSSRALEVVAGFVDGVE